MTIQWPGFKQRNWRYKWRLIFTDSWPGLAGWHPQPVHYTTTTQHHTHTFRKHCPVLHAHFIHSRAVSLITLSLWFLTNQLQFDTSWKLIELWVLLTVCTYLYTKQLKCNQIFGLAQRFFTLKLIYPRKMSNFLLQIDSTKRDSWLQFCRQLDVALWNLVNLFGTNSELTG